MIKMLSVLLCLLLLTGCGTEPSTPTETTQIPTEAAQATAAPTEPKALYDPGSQIEALTAGSVKAYALGRTGLTDIRALGSDLLLFGEECLLKVGGEPLHILAEAALEFPIFASDPAVQVSEKGITYFDFTRTQLVYLDTSLREVSRLDLPEGMTGSPALSRDRKNLYYLTDTALRTLNLESGIDRLVKEMSFCSQSITALHCDDSILECSVTDENGNWRALFLKVSTGEQVAENSSYVTLQTSGDRYFVTVMDGTYPEKLTGTADSQPLSLHCPHLREDLFPVLNRNGLLTIAGDGDALAFDYFDLTCGARTASLTLPERFFPLAVLGETEEDCLWFLIYDSENRRDTLCRWDLTQSAVADDTAYLGIRRTRETPDTQALADCARLAEEIGNRHQLDILIWTDASDAAPQDYTLIPEHQSVVLLDALTRLDAALSHYPKGFLRESSSEMGDGILRIGLVREIQGDSNQLTLDSASGIQYWDEAMNPYIQLQISTNMEQHLHHELFHIAESRIFSSSQAFDDWEDLNPEGFTYSYNYLDYQSRTDLELVDGEGRAFIDFYATTFPREDRARIMEYAMMPGNEACFESPILQAKLRCVCIGIREAFRLKKTDTVLLWEQYLQEPLNFKK